MGLSSITRIPTYSPDAYYHLQAEFEPPEDLGEK